MSIKQGAVKISELQSVKGKFSLAGKKAIVTGGAGGFFLAVLVTCLIGLPTMVISCWRTKEGPRLRAAEHPVCRHVSRDVLDSGAARLVECDMTNQDAGKAGMVCGGVTTVLLEPIQ